jgi:glutaredoxin-related protein
MVFVRGTLVGGCDDLNRLIASGELKQLLAA